MASRQSEPSFEQSHEPELLRQLREKSLSINMKIQKLTSQNKQKIQIRNTLKSQLTKLQQQTEVQFKKNKSLIVLLNQLQQTYHNQYLQQKQEKQNDQVGLTLQNSLLRFLLIRSTQDIKQAQKLANLIKHMMLDKNKGKAKQFIKKSNFVEGQSQIIAKLKAQLNLLRNQNLQCKRKWYNLQQETKNLQSHNKLLSIQNERQKTELKTMYEQYLERINQAKTKIVSYNQTQKQSTINQYLVKQIAILQQKRVEIQEENNNLQYHHESLKEQLERIEVENKQFGGFFNEGGQEGTLAQKMKKRIQQLRDVLMQCKKKSKNTRGAKLNKILQNIKSKYKVILQSNDYVQLKTKQQTDFGSFLEEKQVADFFGKILQEKDKSLLIMRQQQNNYRQKIKQLQNQKQLLESQIENLKQNLSFQDWDTKFVQKRNWENAQLQSKTNEKQSVNDKFGKQISYGMNQSWNQKGNFTFDSRNYDYKK